MCTLFSVLSPLTFSSCSLNESGCEEDNGVLLGQTEKRAGKRKEAKKRHTCCTVFRYRVDKKRKTMCVRTQSGAKMLGSNLYIACLVASSF